MDAVSARSGPRRCCEEIIGRLQPEFRAGKNRSHTGFSASDAPRQSNIEINNRFAPSSRTCHRQTGGAIQNYATNTSFIQRTGIILDASELQGDQIFNGAIDNASGVASVIELADAFMKVNPPPKRSVLFMATTAEEAGLLGMPNFMRSTPPILWKTLATSTSSMKERLGKRSDIEDLSLGFPRSTIFSLPGQTPGPQRDPGSRPDKGKIYRATFRILESRPALAYIGKGEHLLSRPETAPSPVRLNLTRQITTSHRRSSFPIGPLWRVQDVQLLFRSWLEVTNGDSF